jgi:ABC-type transport system substrate-binding protein
MSNDKGSSWNPVLSRRALMMRAMQAGGLAAFGGSLLAACGGDEDGGEAAPPATTGGATTAAAEPPPAATTAPAGQPVRGGTLRYAAVSGLRGFDPQKFWDGFIWHGTLAISDQLLNLPPQGGPLGPGLSELPEVNADGTLYTFKLRPGVMFHHGREMTADDAKFSLDRLVSPSFGCEGASLYTGLPIVGLADVVNEKANEVSGIKAVDDLTFTIELERPESALPYLLSMPFAAVVPRDVVEEMGDEKFNLAPVSTGPFVMKDVDLEKGLVLERFPDYWNPEQPYLDRVEWTFGTDVDLAVLQVQDGEIDMIMDRIPNATAVQLRDDPEVEGQLLVGPVNLLYYHTLNVQSEAFKDIRVRRAVAMALDRERLARTLKGLAEPVTGGLFSKLSPYYQEGLQIPYDPEGAKALLAEAGAEGLEFELLAQEQSPFNEMAQTAQADLKAVGINAKTKIATVEVFINDAYNGNPPPMVTYLWDLPYPHGSYFFDGAFTQAAIDANCCNLSMWSNPGFEEQVKEAHAAQEETEIVDLYKQMDKTVVLDEVAAVPMFLDVRVDFASTRVGGLFTPATLTTASFFKDYWLSEA